MLKRLGEFLLKPVSSNRLVKYPSPLVKCPSLARNSLFNLCGQVSQMLAALVFLPLTVRLLGAERVGILSLVWILLGYLSVLDLGIGRALTRAVATAVATPCYGTARRLFWSAATAQALAGVVGSVVLMVLAPRLAERVLTVPGWLVAEAHLGIAIAASSLPVVLFSSSVAGLLQAAERFDLTNLVAMPAAVLSQALPFLCALWYPSVPLVVSALVGTRVVSALVMYALARRVFPELDAGWEFSWRELRPLLAFGGWVSVSNIVNPLLMYLDRFMLGVMMSMAAVTYYSVPYQAVNSLSVLAGSIALAAYPALSGAAGSCQVFRLQSVISGGVKAVVCLLGLPVAVVACFGPELMRLWMDLAFGQHSGRALQILALGVLVNGLATLPYSLLQASGRPDLPAKFHLIELPLHLVLLWIFIRMWGVEGAALAWTVRATIDAALLFTAASRVTGLALANVALTRLLRVLPALLVITAAGGWIWSATALGLVRAAGAVLLVLGGCAVLWWRGLDEEDRKRLPGLVLSEHK